ncbi:MAG: glycerophosphodiester phosphodiesterase family protein [Bacteroidota bacterium]
MLRFIFITLISFVSFSQDHSVLFYGHRGCRGLMPENSIESFQKAIDFGVDGIELDVVVNKNKQLVISHEPYFKSSFCFDADGKEITNEKQWNIYEMSQDEIVKFDCGSKTHPHFSDQVKIRTHKPLLQEFFSKVNLSKTTILFEVKSNSKEYGISQPLPNEFVKLIASEIANFTYRDNIIFMSFDKQILEEIHRQLPMYKCIYLTYLPFVSAKKFVKELSFTPYGLGMNYKTISRKDARFLHENNLKLFAWTVNKSKDKKILLLKQVDGIITDYPNLICK